MGWFDAGAKWVGLLDGDATMHAVEVRSGLLQLAAVCGVEGVRGTPVVALLGGEPEPLAVPWPPHRRETLPDGSKFVRCATCWEATGKPRPDRFWRDTWQPPRLVVRHAAILEWEQI
jgi:hypothetical protein